jgi:hypothetical protein
VTALRLKALHLANFSNYTYSKGYLGLLSSIGYMLGVVVCNVMALHGILGYAKERFRGVKVLPKPIANIRWLFRKDRNKPAPQRIDP